MKNISHRYRAGFGLIEVLVGMVIGLIAVLAIVQTVSTFEEQKRTTTTGTDAQSNGAIALYTIQRWGQAAGFGLPASDPNNQPLNCAAPINYVGGTTLTTDILPFQITDGGGGASDTLTIRTARDTTSMGAPPLRIAGVAGNLIAVKNSLSCNVGDIVLATTINNCAMSNVTAVNATSITVTSAAPTAFQLGGILGCMRGWSDITYAVANDNLTEMVSTLTAVATPAVPTIAGIVNIQAQYGIAAAANSKPVVKWVDATAATGYASPISPVNRVLIRAVRVAVVARSNEYEKTLVSSPCFSTTAAYSTAPASPPGIGVCAWEGSATNPAPMLTITDPADGTDWHRYRYRVFETIIPLRNMVWLPQP